MAHGILFHMWERSGGNIRGEAAHNGRKLHLDGRCAMTLAVGQYKYGDELIAQIYGPANLARVAARRADNYSRIQVYLGPADLQTATILEDIARSIRELNAKEIAG
jgi:hypothetical protein